IRRTTWMSDGTRRVPEHLDSDPPAGNAGNPPTRRVPETGTTGTVRVPEGAGPALLDRVSASGQKLPLGALAPGTVLCGDCTVTLRPHATERPGLFLCDAPEGRVVVKVAPLGHPPKPELWSRLPNLHHPNVLRTYRITEENGFFFEVQEYCAGGTLDDRV